MVRVVLPFLAGYYLSYVFRAVNAVLGGNIGDSFAIKWRMWIFYLLVRLQKYIPLCPRRTLVPKNEEAPAAPRPAEAVEAVS